MMHKRYHELTVTGICSALDISRRTFYLHFTDMEEVFRHIFEEVNETLYAEFADLKSKLEKRGEDGQGGEMIREILRIINATIMRNKAYLTRVAVEPSYGWVLAMHVNLMKEMVKQCLNQSGLADGMREVYLDYYIAGVLELYFQWYRGALSMTLDEIGEVANGLLLADLAYFAGK